MAIIVIGALASGGGDGDASTVAGNEYLHRDAQGKFLLVSVTVKNIGKEAQLFDASSQKLLDGTGTEYSADGAAGIYLGDQAKRCA